MRNKENTGGYAHKYGIIEMKIPPALAKLVGTLPLTSSPLKYKLMNFY